MSAWRSRSSVAAVSGRPRSSCRRRTGAPGGRSAEVSPPRSLPPRSPLACRSSAAGGRWLCSTPMVRSGSSPDTRAVADATASPRRTSIRWSSANCCSPTWCLASACADCGRSSSPVRRRSSPPFSRGCSPSPPVSQATSPLMLCASSPPTSSTRCASPVRSSVTASTSSWPRSPMSPTSPRSSPPSR